MIQFPNFNQFRLTQVIYDKNLCKEFYRQQVIQFAQACYSLQHLWNLVFQFPGCVQLPLSPHLIRFRK